MKDSLIFSKHEQRSEGWYVDRCGKITASRFADVMQDPRGGNTWSGKALSYANQLVAEIIREVPSPEVSNVRALDWGREQEARAKKHYEWIKEVKVKSVTFCYDPNIEGVGCSLDGIVMGDKNLEIKCPYNQNNHCKYLSDMDLFYEEYKWQVQGQMWVTGAPECDHCTYDPRWDHSYRMGVITVERDEDMIFELEDRVADFRDFVNRKVEKLRERFES